MFVLPSRSPNIHGQSWKEERESIPLALFFCVCNTSLRFSNFFWSYDKAPCTSPALVTLKELSRLFITALWLSPCAGKCRVATCAKQICFATSFCMTFYGPLLVVAKVTLFLKKLFFLECVRVGCLHESDILSKKINLHLQRKKKIPLQYVLYIRST